MCVEKYERVETDCQKNDGVGFHCLKTGRNSDLSPQRFEMKFCAGRMTVKKWAGIPPYSLN